MDEPQYPNTAEGYTLHELIGKGMNNNEVWRATVVNRQEEVAIKIIDLEQYSQQNLESIRKEVQIMNISKHDNIVPYYCSFVDKTKLWLVMRMLAGSCLDLLKYRFQSGIEDEGVIAVIMRSTLQGLNYLHQHHQIHRDIKAANILLAPDGRVQLADFGVSAALDAHDQRRTTFVGTVCYMAPEVLDPEIAGGYDGKADFWSLGITAIELAYGKPPYALNQPMKVIMLLMKNPSPSLEVPEHEVKTLETKAGRKFSAAFRDFVGRCLQKDPKKRPTAAQLLGHSFLKNLPQDESKCDAYLVKHVLSGLPSAGERFRAQIAKSGSKSDASIGAAKGNEDEDDDWDFGPEGTKNAAKVTASSSSSSSSSQSNKPSFKGFSEEPEIEF